MAPAQNQAPLGLVTPHPEAVARAPGILQTFPEVDTLTRLSAAMTGYALKLDAALLDNADRPNAARMKQVRDLLIIQAVCIKAEAMGLLGDQAAQAVADLKSITDRANAEIEEINQLKKALRVGVALLDVVVTFAAGIPGPAIASLGKLKKALDAK